MKRHIARLVWLARLAAMALSALCLMETSVHAQRPPHAFQIISAGGDVGLARGQTLRYTWVELKPPAPRGREFVLLGIQVRVLAANGLVVAQAEAPAMGAGTSQSFDFIRDQISLPGEPGTGRLQLRLDVAVAYASAFGIEASGVRQQILEAFDDAAEVIDTLTGRTTVSFNPKEFGIDKRPSSAAGGAATDSVWIDLGSPLGIAPEQTLRITVFNPLPTAPPGQDGRKYMMLFAPVILDPDGQAIAREDEIALAPGQSHSFDFRRADLPSNGEPGTGRLQVRSEIRHRYYNGFVSRFSAGGRSLNVPGTLELVDEGSGKTMLLVPAVQAARSAARRIQ
jgi:hypothetical protein